MLFIQEELLVCIDTIDVSSMRSGDFWRIGILYQCPNKQQVITLQLLIHRSYYMWLVLAISGYVTHWVHCVWSKWLGSCAYVLDVYWCYWLWLPYNICVKSMFEYPVLLYNILAAHQTVNLLISWSMLIWDKFSQVCLSYFHKFALI